jgi:hypothetical protein
MKRNIVDVHGFKGSEVQGYVFVSGPRFGGVLAIMWQNQHFLQGLRVFNFVFVPNLER